ncbi:MAG: cellulase family glycosylhydrolase [Candidatus Hydrogenedentes bacterium]|nr:cellulase family glycosylhydrolase [Candidatus Hydrogenedentota bacterium]
MFYNKLLNVGIWSLVIFTTLFSFADVYYLPRIFLREKGGKTVFCTEDGELIVPRGFNHVVLEHKTSGWHALFNTNIYNPEEIESVLQKMSEWGANVIRVWAWGVQNEHGAFGMGEDDAINPRYLENFLDFLKKANKYKVYVIPIFDEYPKYGYFSGVAQELHIKYGEKDLPLAEGYNRQFFWESLIEAKAKAIKRFIEKIKERDENLINGVLAWELQNEVYVKVDNGPFKDFESTVKLPNGITLKNDTPENRQKIYDMAILHWANQLAKAIKEIVPDSLVTVGMWTSDSAGRSPTAGLPHDGKDPRMPPRPSVLGGEECLLDFIDIHIYPWDGTSKVRAECHEHGLVKKPVIVGEYGVFPPLSIEESKRMLIEMLTQAYMMGYIGDLFWVWDLRDVSGQTYSAVSEDLGKYVMSWKGWQAYLTK